MATKNMKVVIVAGLIGCFSSFPTVAENSRIESEAPAKILALKTASAANAADESSQSVRNQETAEGRHPTSEPSFELWSLQGVLSFVLLMLFLLVLIKGQILKED